MKCPYPNCEHIIRSKDNVCRKCGRVYPKTKNISISYKIQEKKQ